MTALLMDKKLDIAHIVRDYQTDVWGYLRLLGCDAARADDLTQEAFLVVLQKPFVERSRAETLGYLRNAARFAFLNSLRAESRGHATEQAAVAEKVWAEFAGDDAGEERVTALRECMSVLENHARRVIELRFRDGWAGADIAAALEMSQTAVNTLVHRAKAALRECMERKLEL